MLNILIGPNGYGKTTALGNKKQELISSGINEKDILFLESEILVLDEMKDTTDKTFAMEYIISEILENDDINSKKEALSDAIDSAVTSSIDEFNEMIDSVVAFNGQTRSEDVIKVNNPKEFKKLVKIDSRDLKNKLGSGQRMHFVLSMVKRSRKQYIFLDEPEKHSHPSLLNYLAKLIRDLSETKTIYIATHSPKLLEMLNFSISDIEIYNDRNYGPAKQIDLNEAINSLPQGVNVANLGPKSQTYYDVIQLEKNIKEIHAKEFIEALFSKKVYIVEGINDELFIKKMLFQNGKIYDDYYIYRCFGKQHFFPFIKIFQNLGIDIGAYFDADTQNGTNNLINQGLENFSHYKFEPNIEAEIGYTGNKGNTVDFLNYLDSLTIEDRYDI